MAKDKPKCIAETGARLLAGRPGKDMDIVAELNRPTGEFGYLPHMLFHKDSVGIKTTTEVAIGTTEDWAIIEAAIRGVDYWNMALVAL